MNSLKLIKSKKLKPEPVINSLIQLKFRYLQLEQFEKQTLKQLEAYLEDVINCSKLDMPCRVLDLLEEILYIKTKILHQKQLNISPVEPVC